MILVHIYIYVCTCHIFRKCDPFLVATLDALENSKIINKRMCPKDLKSFLSLEYTCVAGKPTTPNECQTFRIPDISYKTFCIKISDVSYKNSSSFV